MKTLILTLIVLSSSAFAKPEFICSYLHAKKVVPIAEAHSSNDKNRHCTVSCMFTLRCPVDDVLAIGVLKEVKDVFGPGNAEVDDLKADLLGIELAVKGAARTNKQCLQQCDLYYKPR